MKVLFDIVHPADVHFFEQSMAALLKRGDAVTITSREKDMTIPLLDASGWPHTPISRLGKGRFGLLAELVTRDLQLWKIARRVRPDLFVSNNSPCAAHIAWLRRRPSLVFDDTETHRYSQRLYAPCVTEIHSPDCYRKSLGPKQRLYPGYHALAYLHPNHFTPDAEVARRAGIDPEQPHVMLRLVGWGAMHDIGRRHLQAKDWDRILSVAQQYAKVVISSEARLPDDLEPYRLKSPITDIHHILAYSTLLVSDSGSMTSEAVVLGIPAIYCDEVGLGYTDDQERRYGLCINVKPGEMPKILDALTMILTLPDARQHFAEARARLLREKIDVAAYQLAQIDRLAKPERF